MTKQEYIKDKYRNYPELQKHIDGNGWCGYFDEDEKPYIPDPLIDHIFRNGYYFYRLKELKGVEDNNGWIKINNETDLPDKNSTKRYSCGQLNEFGGFQEKALPVGARYLYTLYRNGITHYKAFVQQPPPTY